ncbi:MAG: protein kinase [Candidatus Dormibacteria bacterium]
MPALPAKYTVERVLGSGATGTVLLALDHQLDRPVAIKQLAPSLATDPAFLERFREEARTMARLDNDHCVRVFDFIEEPGEAALVTEYIDGASLRSIIDHAGPLTPEQSLGILKGALKGLGAAHELGIVHRDVKPENMLSDREGVSKLADFGQAVPRSAGPGAAGGIGGGTAAYMSPEQAAGGDVDPRSDLYSAGVVLFELLTGKVPFRGDNALAVMRRHINEHVPDGRTVKDDLPEPVALMLLHATAHDVDARPQSADELLAELETAAVAAYGEDWEKRSSHKKLVLAALAALGLLGAGAVGAAAAGATGEAVVGATPWGLIAAGVLGAAVILGGGFFVVRGNLLGQHSGTSVVTSRPSATAGSTPSANPGPSATPTADAGPSPSATASAPVAPPPGSVPATSSAPVASQPPPATVPSPTHTFVVTQVPGAPASLSISGPRIYFQQCTVPYASPGPGTPNCNFYSDGTPYYSQATAYPSAAGMYCGSNSIFNIAEQFDFANGTANDIPVTVAWSINWADGSTSAATSTDVVKANSSGTHAATNSQPQTQPTLSSNPPSPVYGNGAYTLTWTDPAGTHKTSSEQSMWWACGTPPQRLF